MSAAGECMLMVSLLGLQWTQGLPLAHRWRDCGCIFADALTFCLAPTACLTKGQRRRQSAQEGLGGNHVLWLGYL